MTSDPEILDMVSGMTVPFVQNVPKQKHIPRQIPLKKDEQEAVTNEIKEMLKKGVVVPTVKTDNDYFSTVFTVPKPIGHRFILNLKLLNEVVEYKHFKMETAMTAINLMQPFTYMGSIDLSEAYYVLPIRFQDTKYLKFQWQGKCLMYTCCPMGLSPAPRKYTKLLKPVYATLRQWGFVYVGYIDDSWTANVDREICRKGLVAGNDLFISLGFITNLAKSVMIPTQCIEFLGLILDSIRMIVMLTAKKTEKVKNLCLKFISKTRVTIRDLAKLIGNIVATLPAAQFGKMHYRNLEVCKILALKQNAGNYDAKCTLGRPQHEEIQWWIDNIEDIYNPIMKGSPEISISSDASGRQWGCFCDGESALNYFSQSEQEFSINVKELLAVKYALRCFQDKLHHKHILVLCDNTAAISYVKDMGGTKHGLMNQIAIDIWNWAIEHSVWISVTHIAGIDNTLADTASRTDYNPRTEWSLKQEVFDEIVAQFGPVDIDLFASNLNNKLPRYVSWQRDPFSEHVDAFTLDWSNLNVYVFPPFSILNRVVRKITENRPRKIILVIPNWPTQAWYPVVMQYARKTMILPKKCVIQPVKQKTKSQKESCENMLKRVEFRVVVF